jgi:hypothetical protein
MAVPTWGRSVIVTDRIGGGGATSVGREHPERERGTDGQCLAGRARGLVRLGTACLAVEVLRRLGRRSEGRSAGHTGRLLEADSPAKTRLSPYETYLRRVITITNQSSGHSYRWGYMGREARRSRERLSLEHRRAESVFQRPRQRTRHRSVRGT